MESQETSAVIVCEKNLDITVAAQVLVQLREAIDAGPNVEIDATAVERVDTACLQALCVFSLEAKKKGVTLNWRSVSPSFRAAADQLGLAGHLGLHA